MKSISYFDKLKDPRWQQKRLEVMQRDKFTCRDCGDKTKTLHVHHCHYQKGEPWSTGNDLLLTLCEDCHDSRGCVEHDLKLEFSRVLAQVCPEHLEALMADFRHVSSIAEEGLSNWGNGAKIMPADDFEYLSLIRWYIQACKIPAFREAYITETGMNPWEKNKQESSHA